MLKKIDIVWIVIRSQHWSRQEVAWARGRQFLLRADTDKNGKICKREFM